MKLIYFSTIFLQLQINVFYNSYNPIGNEGIKVLGLALFMKFKKLDTLVIKMKYFLHFYLILFFFKKGKIIINLIMIFVIFFSYY